MDSAFERDSRAGSFEWTDYTSRALMQHVLESSPDCIKILDQEGRFLFIGRGGCAAMEVDDAQSLVGANWIDFWTGEDRTAAKHAIAAALNGKTGTFQGFCPTAKGTPKWWDVIITPLATKSGRPERLLAVSRDITELHSAKAALESEVAAGRKQASLFHTAVTKMKQGLCFFDGQQRLIVCNDRYASMYRLTSDETRPGSTLADISESRERAGTSPIIGSTAYLDWREKVAGSMVPQDSTVELRDGRTIAIHHEPMPDGGWVSTHDDITEQKNVEETLRSSEELLRLALQAGRMFAWERNLETGIVERSKNAEDLIGLGSGPVLDFISRVHLDDSDKVPDLVSGMWGTDGKQAELRYLCPDGKQIWMSARSARVDEPGKPKRLVGVTFDITDRKNAEAEVWRLAHQDELTGLSNRRHFQQRFDEALSTARQKSTAVSLLLLDLDAFKDVNDTLGHDAGDAVLRETADRLRRLTRDCDTVARIAGDEFAFVLVEPFELDHAIRFADYVVEELRKPFRYAGRLLTCKATIGVSNFPSHDAAAADLFKDADIALYRAKAQGRNRALAYGPEMKAETERRFAVCTEVRDAIVARQIVPFYQPKVCLDSGRIVGFEALARWEHPSKGVLTPAYFGVAFEDLGICEMIGDAILHNVAHDISKWLAEGHYCGRVAMNMSSAEFNLPDLADRVLGALADFNVSTDYFEIEVTETVFLGAQSDLVSRTLNRLRQAGIRIALDDFGTGYASLTHLKQFPVDHIKIDQSFVRGLPGNSNDQAIVSAVLGLGRTLGMEVTAEGIETKAQAAHLRASRCAFGQGYFFGRPMPGTLVPSFLANASSAPEIAA